MSEEVVLEVEREQDAVADEVVIDAAPEPEARREQRDPSARRPMLIVGAVSLIVIIGLAVALIVSQVQLSSQNSQNADRTSALASAKAYAIDVASYSYQHLNHDFGRVESESTPAFRHNFTQSSDSLAKVLVQYKAVATAKVVHAAVESVDSSQAVVLLFVNQSVANSAQGKTTDYNRIVVTLARSGDRWLLADLKVV